MAKVQATLKKVKETPGTWQYKEDGDDPQVGTLYLKKSIVQKLGNSETIVVTVEAKTK